ncbi:MAG: Flp1 family type IVb pilin [Firmicutes bacterium]|nr:Flp1 family type IVb pilin [Bacillota bacterium]
MFKKIFIKLYNVLKKDRGIETIEVVIILVILVALGFAFRNVITGWYNHLVSGIDGQIMNGSSEVPNGL